MNGVLTFQILHYLHTTEHWSTDWCHPVAIYWLSLLQHTLAWTDSYTCSHCFRNC